MRQTDCIQLVVNVRLLRRGNHGTSSRLALPRSSSEDHDAVSAPTEQVHYGRGNVLWAAGFEQHRRPGEETKVPADAIRLPRVDARRVSPLASESESGQAGTTTESRWWHPLNSITSD